MIVGGRSLADVEKAVATLKEKSRGDRVGFAGDPGSAD
jgi:hypothetical protein